MREAADQIGIPEAEVVDRAVQMFLLAEEVHDLKLLKEDMDYWQERYLETSALTDERIDQLEHAEGGDMDI